jgi:hypothetical protein
MAILVIFRPFWGCQKVSKKCKNVHFCNIEKHENRLKMVKNVILEVSKKGHFYGKRSDEGWWDRTTGWSKVSARSQGGSKKVR